MVRALKARIGECVASGCERAVIRRMWKLGRSPSDEIAKGRHWLEGTRAFQRISELILRNGHLNFAPVVLPTLTSVFDERVHCRLAVCTHYRYLCKLHKDCSS